MKKRLRETFRDEYGIQWSDALLDEILYEAQREYALNSGGLVGRYEIIATGSPVLSLPEDFFQAIEIISVDGTPIPIVSFRKLAEDHGDFREDKGSEAQYCCFNFDSFGKFRLYPQVPSGTKVGTLYYKRFPKADEWVCRNSVAIEQYALFLMYQFTGKNMAQNCYSAFIDAIHREQDQMVGFGSKNVIRKGVYY